MSGWLYIYGGHAWGSYAIGYDFHPICVLRKYTFSLAALCEEPFLQVFWIFIIPLTNKVLCETENFSG